MAHLIDMRTWTAYIAMAAFLAMPVHAAGKSECAAELETLCAADATGPEDFVRCVRASDGLLSPACRSQLAAARKPREEARERRRERLRSACEADVDRLCGDVRRRAKPIARCLERNRSEVSETCLRAASSLIARHAS